MAQATVEVYRNTKENHNRIAPSVIVHNPDDLAQYDNSSNFGSQGHPGAVRQTIAPNRHSNVIVHTEDQIHVQDDNSSNFTLTGPTTTSLSVAPNWHENNTVQNSDYVVQGDNSMNIGQNDQFVTKRDNDQIVTERDKDQIVTERDNDQIVTERYNDAPNWQTRAPNWQTRAPNWQMRAPNRQTTTSNRQTDAPDGQVNAFERQEPQKRRHTFQQSRRAMGPPPGAPPAKRAHHDIKRYGPSSPYSHLADEPDLCDVEEIALHPAEEEEDDSLWSGDGTNSEHSSEAEEEPEEENEGNNSVEASMADLFDPLSSKKAKQWSMPKHMNEYVEKYFTEWVDDDTVREHVLEPYPIPEHDRLQPLKLDEEMLDLIPKHARTGVAIQDQHNRRTQKKMLETLGPLTKAWQITDARKRKGEDTNLAELLEKSVFAIGQTLVMSNFYRRTSVLTRFVGNQKLATEVTRKNGAVLAKNKSSLFGATFYKALYKKAKGNKHLSEIRTQFGYKNHNRRGGRGKNQSKPPYTQRDGGQHHKRQGDGTERDQNKNRPFRRGAPRGRGSAGRGHKQARWVCTYVSNTSVKLTKRKCTNTNPNRINTPRNNQSKPYPTLPTNPHNSGQSNPMPTKLGKNHGRPVHLGPNKRHYARVHFRATPTVPTEMANLPAKRTRSDANRNRKSAEERGNNKNQTNQRPVLESLILETEERRYIQTDHKPKESEQVHCVPTLQNGEYSNASPTSTKRGLVRKNRLEGRILLPGNSQTTPKISQIPMARGHIRIPNTPLRPGLSPENVHKNHETSNEHTEKNRQKTAHLSRRPDPAKPVKRRPDQRQKHNNLDPPELGPGDQHNQVSANTITTDGVSRLHTGHKGTNVGATSREATEPSRRLQSPDSIKGDNSETPSRCNRKIISNKTGSPTSTTTLQTSTNAENERTPEIRTKLRGNVRTNPSMQNRTKMVDGTLGELEWQNTPNTIPRPDDNVRRLERGLGSNNGRSPSPRTMESGRSKTAHQRPRTDSSRPGTENVHQTNGKVSCTPANGQQLSSSCNIENGNEQIPITTKSNERNLESSTTKGDHTYCRTSARREERRGRQTEQGVQGLQLLDARKINIQTTAQPDGSVGSRYVRRQTDPSIGEIHELEARPGLDSNRCPADKLGKTKWFRIRFPTILPDQQMPSKSPEGQNDNNDHNAHMAEPNMVPDTADLISSEPDTPAEPGKPAAGHTRAEPPTNTGEKPILSSLDSFRNQLKKAGFSEESTTLLLQSWRTGTQSAYNTPWNKWTSWCNSRQIDPFQATVADIGNFLAGEFDRGLEYRTLNVYRSALSAFHPNIGDTPVGSHPMIKRLMAGVFNGRPPMPRYTDTWDANKVLEHCTSMAENRDLTLKQLTIKTAILVAPTTAYVILHP